MLHSAALALFIVAAPAGKAGAPHPFTVHDLVAFDRVSDPQPSPDGKRVVFAVSRLDLDANRRRTDLWLVGIDGAGLRRLTAHASGSDNSARWSADGRFVYFLSSRSGSSQLWRIPSDGGEAERVSSLPLDVSAFVLSPDGKRVVVALDVFVDCVDLACTKARLDELGSRKATGKLYDHLFARHWDEWNDHRRSHLHILSLADPQPLDLMKGMDADSPSKPFGGPEEVAFSPDGKTLVFSAKDVGREEAWSTNFDLFSVPADGSAAPTKLTAGNAGNDTAPLFSPDGRTLAYLAQKTAAYEADRARIILRDWASGAERVLAEPWDRSAGSLSWSLDGRELFVTAEDVLEQPVFAIDTRSGAVRKLVETGVNKGGVRAAERVVFTREHLRNPAEVYSVAASGRDLKVLTHFNDAKIAATELGEPAKFSFKGASGDTVWGWVIKPVEFDPAKKYPVALLIHGGPQGSFNDDFHYRWNPQTYAGAGFAVVEVDFHGSTGYGQKFTDDIRDDWGGKPLVDLQKGLEAALSANAWIDGSRACALGASFGGYMINYIAGAWSDRFRCLVAHDGNIDERMAYFDTEELWFPERDHAGTPWENPASYQKHNPIELVKNWKTPMLVVHGGHDYRVVDTQGLSTFTALQRRGIPSKLLYFPEENHWVLRPANSILWHDTVLDWLKQWTAADGSTPAAAR